jgi:amino acid adenylation domain-containing protein
MNTGEFLDYLKSLNIQFTVNGTKLKISAPAGVITPSLKAEIAERKADLLAFLQKVTVDGNQDFSIQSIKRNQEHLCLSFAQQRLWFLQQLELESGAAYHINRTLRLQGLLHSAALEQAFATILERHEALRTHFVVTDGVPQQVISPPAKFELPFIDLSTQAYDQARKMLKSFLKEGARRPFDLTTDLMLRATLIRMSEDEHVLQIVMHHIASDGWSMGVLTQELSTLYQAFSSEQPNPLPKLPVQYADFAAWQRQWLSGEVLESQLSYWKQHLSGAPPLLELPTDHPRPPQPSYRGAWLPFTLSKSLTDALKHLSHQTGTSLFMTLLSAFNTLLYRYTHQDDIVVGSPIANRNRPELEGLIGFFANTLALRTDLSGNPSFRDLLMRVRQVALDAYVHQDLPFEKLVEKLQPERNLSYSPLFQVMFVLLNTPQSVHQLPGLSIKEERVEHEASQFDLTLFMGESDGGLTGICEYSTDLFEATTIERMVGHFETLLEGIVANPNESIAALPILTEAERQQLLVEWNQTQTDYPHDKCIHQLFEEQVKCTPDAIAVVFKDQHLTYQELNNRANQLAHYLQSLGVGPEVIVGICVERSFEMVVGLLGILKAGGSYVPLDPAYPQERLAYMIDNSQLPLLLTEQTLCDQFSEQPVQIVCIDRDWEAIAQHPNDNADSSVAAKNLAYTIYTSGSTGKPKGVQICHRSAVNFLNSMRHEPGLNADDCLLAVTTISFDIAVLELYLPLMIGARVVLATREVAADATQLAALLSQSGATVMQATPATWQMLLAEGWHGDRQLKILCGGEAMPRSLANQLLSSSAEVWNMYGPTETTVWSAVNRIEPGDAPIVIGRGIANTKFYLIDTNSYQNNGAIELVPVGVAGELLIGGAGLARGYLNRPELTEEKFIPDPFSNQSDARLYRTGDLARYLPDGKIELIGRIDNQVKIRGFRIELGEIEAVLAQHSAIREIAVIVREDIPGDKRLVAYVVPQQEQPHSSDLRSFLQERLPNYMVPSAFVFLDTMPLTPNGKVDRRALPAPDASSLQLDAEFVPPSNPTEELLATIWAEVLGVERVGIHDNFFELGGHSLLATQVISQLNQAFSVELSLLHIFETPTVAGLAVGVTQSQFEHTEDEDIAHLLAELEGLSDEEVQQLLVQEMQSSMHG